MVMIRLLLAVAALLALPAPAAAWGEYGHKLVARIADANLTPAARREMKRILAQGKAAATPTCALKTIEQASVWPDCVRGLGQRFAYSFSWHYQDIDTCGDFDIAEACEGGACVTAQIPRQLAIAADRHAKPADRVIALAFVIHFVGDMHQPLHIGDRRADRGGNLVLANYGAMISARENLHHIWDVPLAERALTEPQAVNPRTPSPEEKRAWAQGEIADWAHEAFDAAKSTTYGNLTDYPDTCAVSPPTDQRAAIGETYIAAATPVVRLQVEKAGIRLAMLLNKAFAR